MQKNAVSLTTYRTPVNSRHGSQPGQTMGTLCARDYWPPGQWPSWLLMHARACIIGSEGLPMRTTIEMKPEHRAKLLELAAHRGAKGFSQLVSEALEAYLRAEADRQAQRKRAVLLKGVMPSSEAKSLREAAEALRRSWR